MLRIIGGDAKGRRLKGPKGLEFRPTTGRVKEFVFSIIGPDLYEAQVLDLFAGSGSLGIEALSRGAVKVTFVEQCREHVRLIEQNVALCHFEAKSRLLKGDVFKVIKYLGKQPSKFDIILADPPFRQSLHTAIVLAVAQQKILQKNGMLIIEHQIDDILKQESNLHLIRQRHFGHCMVSIYD
jgi:16S rRNA (guanine966-N2)-methyltransferase